MTKDYVKKINIGNKALDFIDKRLADKDYRGVHLFQHYRYDLDYVLIVLEELLVFNKNNPGELLKIRTTDSSKRPENNEDEIDYAMFVNRVRRRTGKGTQDVIRKIIFVDCNRMGFIDRYDNQKVLISPYSSTSVSYVSVSEKGKKLLQAANLKEKYFIFSSGLYNIFGNLVNILRDLITKHNLEYISKYEFMYFVSAVSDDSNFSLEIEECADLIKEFRLLGDIDRKNVTRALKREMKPENYKGNKVDKRDFSNWQNEADQTFILLSTTVYFEVRNKIKLLLNNSDTSLEYILDKNFIRKRSLQEKNNYYSEHCAQKTIGFELHHVVALEYADSPSMYKLLDSWKNLVYIDAYSHAKITQNRNRNVYMDLNNNDVILSDKRGSDIYLKHSKNIIYSPKKKEIMYSYNKKLLQIKEPA